MKIITLTLNPAFDTHCHTARFLAFHENFAAVTACNAGGKGINLSRALIKNGIPNCPVVVVGNENSDNFLKMLSDDGLDCSVISVPGRIRENLTLHSDGDQETRISFAGFAAPADLLNQLDAILYHQIDTDTVVTVTGRNTDGLPLEDVKRFLSRLQNKGAKLVIDSRSFALADLEELKPWLIKPNQEEISQYLGKSIHSFEEVHSAAMQLHAGGIDNVMVSLGSQGALLVCADGSFTAVPPQLEVQSTIGAGDSTIAGFLAAGEDSPAEERLRLAVAFGSAACLSEGSLPPLPENIAMLKPQITVSHL